MANTPISGFTSGSPAQSTDEFVVARSGSNFKLTGSDLKTLSVGAGSVDVASGKTLTASNTLTLAGTDGTTMTFPSTSATLARTDAGNTFTGNQTVNGGTITANAPVLNLSQTWNNSGVTFTGLQFNAAGTSDANSASGSLLLDLQVGGTSRFLFRKDGSILGVSSVAAIGLTSSGASLTSYGDGIFINTSANVRIGGGRSLGFGSSVDGDTLITRRGAANLRLGAADAAAPVAQTLSVQSVVAGTSNTAGANLTITGSQGTGTGAGGSIIFQVAPAGSSGTAQNALSTALTIESTRVARFADRIVPGGHASFGGISYAIGPGGPTLLDDNGNACFTISRNLPGPYIPNDSYPLAWGVNADVRLIRDGAANTLALRNGGTSGTPVPQTFNIYNYWASASDYERGAFYWSGNTLTIATQNAGSGGNRGISVIGKGQVTIESTLSQIYFKTNSANRWFVDTTGAFNAAVDNTLDIGASGANRPRDLFLGRNLVQVGAYHEMAEMTAPAAPAANSVRIYAEDDGSGKTRLMALFATGAAQQIAIEP